ncbi:MAG: hypothetical protein ACRDA5_02910, partial [Clostridium sp.]
MAFMTFFETIMIIIYGNVIFEDSIGKYFKNMIPLCIGLVFLNKYVLSRAPNIALIIIIVILIFSLLINSKKDFIDCAIQIVVGFIIMTFGELISILIVMTMREYITIQQNIILIILTFVFWIVVVIILIKIPNYKNSVLTNRIEDKKLIIGTAITLMLTLLILKRLYDNNFLTGTIGIEIFTYVILIFILGYDIYLLMAKEIMDKNRLQLENNFKPMLDDYIHKLRASDHEYKNHLNAIHTIVEVCDEDEIKNKLKSYIGEIKT